MATYIRMVFSTTVGMIFRSLRRSRPRRLATFCGLLEELWLLEIDDEAIAVRLKGTRNGPDLQQSISLAGLYSELAGSRASAHSRAYTKWIASLSNGASVDDTDACVLDAALAATAVARQQ